MLIPEHHQKTAGGEEPQLGIRPIRPASFGVPTWLPEIVATFHTLRHTFASRLVMPVWIC